MDTDIAGLISTLGMFFIPFLLSLSFHEYAHGLVAHYRGDPTPKMMGRLTMNPFAHAHPIGTFLLPALAIITKIPLFIGWAKPVPINERNLKNPKTDVFWVALAGPASNILLATIGSAVMSIVIHYFSEATYAVGIIGFASHFVLINLMLAMFNLIPVHPLDGGKIIARFLPYDVNQALERAQVTLSFVLLAFLMFGDARFLRIPIAIGVVILSSIFKIPTQIWPF